MPIDPDIRILSSLPASRATILKLGDVDTYEAKLNALERRGLVERLPRARSYTLTDAGRKAIGGEVYGRRLPDGTRVRLHVYNSKEKGE